MPVLDDGEAVAVWVTVEVMAVGDWEGVMVMMTVTRIVEGVGREMMLVEVVVMVVRAGVVVEEVDTTPMGMVSKVWNL